MVELLRRRGHDGHVGKTALDLPQATQQCMLAFGFNDFLLLPLKAFDDSWNPVSS